MSTHLLPGSPWPLPRQQKPTVTKQTVTCKPQKVLKNSQPPPPPFSPTQKRTCRAGRSKSRCQRWEGGRRHRGGEGSRHKNPVIGAKNGARVRSYGRETGWGGAEFRGCRGPRGSSRPRRCAAPCAPAAPPGRRSARRTTRT